MLHIFGKFMILKLKSSRLSYILVLIWPLSSNSRYKSKNDADEAVSVVSLTSSSGGYINGRNSANLELLIDITSSIYLYVKLKALASWIFLSFTSFWRNSDSYIRPSFRIETSPGLPFLNINDVLLTHYTISMYHGCIC